MCAVVKVRLGTAVACRELVENRRVNTTYSIIPVYCG